MHCEFWNTPGVSVIVLGQSNDHDSPIVLSKNIEIAHNRFWNSGLDATDHSTIYAYADDVTIHHNTFTQDVMSRLSNTVTYPAPLSGDYTGPNAAVEVHGSRQRVTNNDVHNYYMGIYVSDNYTSVSRDIVIADNHFLCNFSGLELFRESTDEDGMSDVSIHGNTIRLTNDLAKTADQSLPKVAIGIRASYGAERISVTGNRLYSLDTNGAIGILFNNLAAGTALRDLLISANGINGFSVGVGCTGGGGAAVIDGIGIKGNQITDLVASTLYTIPLGIAVTGNAGMGLIEITHNSIANITTAPATSYGVYLANAIGTLVCEGNQYKGLSTNYVENSPTITYRYGKEARTFGTIPATSTWAIGDIAHNASPIPYGSSPNKYTVRGWLRLTSGTNNVLNTDWAEMRVGLGVL
jgi:hypothetical protein